MRIPVRLSFVLGMQEWRMGARLSPLSVPLQGAAAGVYRPWGDVTKQGETRGGSLGWEGTTKG